MVFSQAKDSGCGERFVSGASELAGYRRTTYPDVLTGTFSVAAVLYDLSSDL